MLKSVRSTAEERFAKIKIQEKKVVKDKDKAKQEVTEKMARLKALRLAKEAVDETIALKAVAEEAAAKKKKSQPVRARLKQTNRNGPIGRNRTGFGMDPCPF